MMHGLFVSLVVLCVTLHRVQGGVRRAACVIECDTGEFGYLTLSQCQADHVCKHTGCGTMCVPESHNIRSQDSRGACIMVCGDSINKACGLNGYDCVSNGCGYECQLRADYIQPANCPPFQCDLHCMTGYYRDENGCDHCQCAYTVVDKSG